MAHFLIEVPHNADKQSCIEAMEVFVRSGSHFLANAYWGCLDSEHTAQMVVDVDNKEQARRIVPPLYREKAKITRMMKITQEEVDHYRKEHDLKEVGKLHS